MFCKKSRGRIEHFACSSFRLAEDTLKSVEVFSVIAVVFELTFMQYYCSCELHNGKTTLMSSVSSEEACSLWTIVLFRITFKSTSQKCDSLLIPLSVFIGISSLLMCIFIENIRILEEIIVLLMFFDENKNIFALRFYLIFHSVISFIIF